MSSISKQHAEVADELEQTLAMNPDLTIDELNLVAQRQMEARNNRPHPDFCGVSPHQMANWMYAPFSELRLVTISVPDELSTSPVMRYLDLIFVEAMQQGGALKATTKGNLPVKLVKKASECLPDFAVEKWHIPESINEFAGSNEDKFTALHYTRVLAELAGLIYRRSGKYCVKKALQKQYQEQGIKAFYLPMLEAAIYKYNWAYLDGWDEDVPLQTFWVFMLWRLQKHGNLDKLTEEVIVAFPDLLQVFDDKEYRSPKEQLDTLIEVRFISRFLEYWGFVTVNPKKFANNQPLPREVILLPLLKESFSFEL